METFYTKEFILAFLYNEMPFSQKRQFVLMLKKDPLLKHMFYELKATVDNVRKLTVIRPSEKLVNYVKNYAAHSFDKGRFLGFGNN